MKELNKAIEQYNATRAKLNRLLDYNHGTENLNEAAALAKKLHQELLATIAIIDDIKSGEDF